jgi:hypothetical protein
MPILRKLLLPTILGAIPIGIGLKLLTFLNYWVYLPLFPNILDCIALIIVGIYLWTPLIKTIKTTLKETIKSN